MEILNYTDDHKAFRLQLRNFLKTEILPNKDRWDKEKLVPKSIWQKMGREGFLCPSISEEYGGLGGDFLYSVIVIEEIAAINYLSLFAFLHSDVVVPYIDTYATEACKKKYLPGCVSGDVVTAVAMTEPDAGSDLSSLTTTAVEQGDEIVINGSKTFISNGINCDLIVLAARDPKVESPYKAISLYLVEADTPGLKKGNQFDKMGMKSQDTTDLFFTDCRIPTTNLLGPKGAGFKLLMEKLQQERLVCAIMGISAAKFAFDWTLNYYKNEIPKGHPLKQSQAVHFAFAEMATQIEIGKTFTDRLVKSHTAGEQVVLQTSMAKYYTTDMGKKLTERCMDLLGDLGGLDSHPLASNYNDLRVMPIFAGTNEIMKRIISGQLLAD